MHVRRGDAILVPAKELRRAKSRLGGRLDGLGRRELAAAMLTDVLRATAAWPMRFVVTADPVLAEVASSCGCLPVADPGDGLNAALRSATGRAADAGALRLLVLPSDVPLVTGEDVSKLMSASAPVAVAPSADGGTAGLLRTPPAVIEPAFGPGSAAVHVQSARTAGLEVEVLELASLSLDVDGLEDLERLAGMPLERESISVARRLLGSGVGR